MFRTEPTEIEYQIFAADDGYAVWREGAPFDVIPYELVRIYTDDDTLLEAYLSGEYAYQTNALPPSIQEVPC